MKRILAPQLHISIHAKAVCARSELSARALTSITSFPRVALFLPVVAVCILALLSGRGNVVAVEACLATTAGIPSYGVEFALSAFRANFS